jgi:hypothetical protein
MPKRVIDFDAMWGSDKIASCAEWAQAEYAWLYGLADPSGCFELTNLRVIWGRVAAIRRNLTIERLEQVFGEFRDKGLLFVWEHEGKLYGHWTGSDVPGRLPPPSWRMRLERLAPPVPKQQLAEYMSGFARGRAGLPGGGFARGAGGGQDNLRFEISNLKESGERDNLKFDISNLKTNGERHGSELRAEFVGAGVAGGNGGLKGGVEGNQAQDLNLGLDWESEGDGELDGRRLGAACGGERAARQAHFSDLKTNSNENSNSEKKLNLKANSQNSSKPILGANSKGNSKANPETNFSARLNSNSNSSANTNALIGSKTKPNSDRPEPWVERVKEGARAAELDFVKERATAKVDANAMPGVEGQKTKCVLPADDSEKCGTDQETAWARGAGQPAYNSAYRDKWNQTLRELRVGQGPVCGPVRVRREVLERIRLRDAARGKSGSP